MSESSYEFLEESNFDGRSPAEIERIKQNATHGNFTLTHGIRPALHFTPEEGFSCIYVDRKPAIIASVTRQKLSDLVKESVAAFPDALGIILARTVQGRDDEEVSGTGYIDRSVLASVLEDDDILDFILNDGRTSVHLFDPDRKGRMQLIVDEDKLLIFQGALQPFKELLEARKIKHKQNMLTINRMTHWHLCTAEHDEKIQHIKRVLNLVGNDDDDDETEDWETSLYDD